MNASSAVLRWVMFMFSPVTDFRGATCRQHEENVCNRGGYCNFMHLKKISLYMELRRQLFGKYRRRHSRSCSRSPYRHQSYDERSHSSRSHGRRYDDRDYHHESRSRRYKSISPEHRRGRSGSPWAKRHRSPIREGSEERCAKIEQWNREKEQAELGNKATGMNNENEWDYDGHMQNGDQYYNQLQPEQSGYQY